LHENEEDLDMQKTGAFIKSLFISLHSEQSLKGLHHLRKSLHKTPSLVIRVIIMTTLARFIAEVVCVSARTVCRNGKCADTWFAFWMARIQPPVCAAALGRYWLCALALITARFWRLRGLISGLIMITTFHELAFLRQLQASSTSSQKEK